MATVVNTGLINLYNSQVPFLISKNKARFIPEVNLFSLKPVEWRDAERGWSVASCQPEVTLISR